MHLFSTVTNVYYFLLSLHEASCCARFGNVLVQASSASRFNSHGTFANVDTSLSCSGNATKWNVCFYGGFATDIGSTVTYLGVYRLFFGTTYRLIPGSSTTYTYTVPQGTPTYTCNSSAIPQSQQYTVNPGDVLMACVPRLSGPGRLTIIGYTTTGTSVLRNSGTCSSLPTDLDVNPSGGFFTEVMGEVLLIEIGRINKPLFHNGMFSFSTIRSE